MHRLTRRILVAITGLLALGVAGPANATLIGDEIMLIVSVNDSPFKTDAAIVGNGVEFDLGYISIDVGASSISFSITDPGVVFPQNLSYTLTDLDWIGMAGEIVAVMAVAFQETIADIGFSSDSVTYTPNILPGDVEAGPLVGMHLITEHDNDATDVPGSGTLALFAAGLFSLGFVRFGGAFFPRPGTAAYRLGR